MASVRGLLVFALAAYAFAVIEGVSDYLHLDRADNTAEEILSSEGLKRTEGIYLNVQNCHSVK